MLQLLTNIGQYYDYNYTAPTTTTSTATTGMAFLVITLIVLVIALAISIPAIIGMWKTFVKAGKPGWAALIPFYDLYIILQISGRPTGWIGFFIGGAILSMIPVVGILFSIALCVLSIIVYIDLAKSFGKDSGFGVLLAFFPFIMFPILGFGDAKYRGPVVAAATPTAPTAPEPAYPTHVAPVAHAEHEAKEHDKPKTPEAE